LVIGVPAGFERVLTTRPYYRSTYVFVSRVSAPLVQSFDDPALEDRLIGVQLIGDDFYNAPPAHALSARGMINNVRGFTVYGDYGKDSPPSEIIQAVARGDIDVAVAWGPMAGFFARRQSVPLKVHAVSPEQDGPARPFTFQIAMGVRRGDKALQQEIDRVIERRQEDITNILAEFGIPLLPMRSGEKEKDDVAAR
jgi:mxaJ protein